MRGVKDNSARYDREMVIKQAGSSPDAGGGDPQVASTVVPSVWCALTPLSASEQNLGLQLQMKTTHRLEFRKWDGFTLTSDMIFADANDESREFKVVGVFDKKERGVVYSVRVLEQIGVKR